MMIYNTTNIPEASIRLIAKIVKPLSLDLEVSSITLRNKQYDVTHGDWGMYHPMENSISLVVPTVITENYKSVSTYYKYTRIINNRLDFLALVLGHEYYHAFQYQEEEALWHLKEYLEVGAEKYEEVAMKRWYDWRISYPNDYSQMLQLNTITSSKRIF